MGNINPIINMHNRKRKLSRRRRNCHGVVKCNCINKPDCPLSNQYQITNVICKAKFTSNFQNYYENIYYGTSEVTFKQRCGNHKKSFNHEKHRIDTELSKEYWRLKELRAQLQVQFLILKRCRPTKRTGICYLCLNKKLFIIEYQGNSPLNQRNELISKFRHKSKFKFMNHKTWPLCGKCPCSEFFLVPFLFHIWTEYRDLQSKSPYSSKMWCNTGQTSPECEHFSRGWRQNIALLVILIPFYCKFTVIRMAEWLWRHETSSSNSRCLFSYIY